MSKNGYDQFFKAARASKAQSQAPSPKIRFDVNQDNIAAMQASSEKRQGVPKADSKNLAEQLRQRVQLQAQTKKKKRAKTPWRRVGVSFVGVIAAGFGLKFHDQIYDQVKKIEISLIGGVQAQTVAAPATVPKPSEVVAVANDAAATSKKEYTQTEWDHFARLNERKRELDAREEELAKMEAEIVEKRKALEKRLSDLENTRAQISQVLQDRVNLDQERIETLVQMYSNMKPSQAAKVFETMDEDLAVEIIGRMKKKNAAEVMNLIKPEKTQIFSERYAGYKRETP
jgi:flagellar motility protein MotE (MotC chaperone)